MLTMERKQEIREEMLQYIIKNGYKYCICNMQTGEIILADNHKPIKEQLNNMSYYSTCQT